MGWAELGLNRDADHWNVCGRVEQPQWHPCAVIKPAFGVEDGRQPGSIHKLAYVLGQCRRARCGIAQSVKFCWKAAKVVNGFRLCRTADVRLVGQPMRAGDHDCRGFGQGASQFSEPRAGQARPQRRQRRTMRDVQAGQPVHGDVRIGDISSKCGRIDSLRCSSKKRCVARYAQNTSPDHPNQVRPPGSRQVEHATRQIWTFDGGVRRALRQVAAKRSCAEFGGHIALLTRFCGVTVSR